MNHGHERGHGHAGHIHGVSVQTDLRWLTIALVINAGFMVVEVAVGVIASSLALLSDAAHMLTDAGAIAIALVAARLARRPPQGVMTYGLGRAEILSDLKTPGEVLADELLADDAFRAEWQRTAVARAVAIEVVRFRVEHGLTQSQLAKQLGMRQPQVARLEAGETSPTVETLIRLSEKLGIEFALDIAPARRHAKLVTRRARSEAQEKRQTYRQGNVRVLVAATS